MASVPRLLMKYRSSMPTDSNFSLTGLVGNKAKSSFTKSLVSKKSNAAMSESESKSMPALAGMLM